MAQIPQAAADKKPPGIEVGVLSETGRREENQDWMGWSRVFWGECYTLADGMGGYKGGATASRMTIEGIERCLKEQPSDVPFQKALQVAVQKTNNEVYRAAQSGNPEMSHMGSTLAVALISGKQLIVGNIGDSRIYLYRKGKLKQLTTDHTSVQRMVAAGMITADQARSHPDAHILNRALGSKPEAEIEVAEPIELEEGDGILLCSDGLSGYAQDKQITKILARQTDVQRVPAQLVNLALKSGSDDNITVQFIRYGKATGIRRTLGLGSLPRAVLLASVAFCCVAIALAIPSVRKLLSSGAEVSPQVTATDGRIAAPANHSPIQLPAPYPTAVKPATKTPEKSADIASAIAPVAPIRKDTHPKYTPVPAPAYSIPVLVLVTGKSDKSTAKKIEGALKSMGKFTVQEVTQAPGLDEESSILYMNGSMDKANDLKNSLQSITNTSWTTELNEDRVKQYQTVVKGQAQTNLLIILPRGEE